MRMAHELSGSLRGHPPEAAAGRNSPGMVDTIQPYSVFREVSKSASEIGKLFLFHLGEPGANIGVEIQSDVVPISRLVRAGSTKPRTTILSSAKVCKNTLFSLSLYQATAAESPSVLCILESDAAANEATDRKIISIKAGLKL